jgi:acetyl-CoA carboxylase biotin carboxyl carrier protein
MDYIALIEQASGVYMDIQEIKQLIKIVEKSGIDEIELEEDGRKIRISKRNAKTEAPTGMINPMYFAPPPQLSLPPQAQQGNAVSNASDPAVAAIPKENFIEVRSPMVGTFYQSPSPDSEPYVEVGTAIKPGMTLCIIEAMKLMNEIEAEHSGKIAKILVDNSQPVEYNQLLFLIEKSA